MACLFGQAALGLGPSCGTTCSCKQGILLSNRKNKAKITCKPKNLPSCKIICSCKQTNLLELILRTILFMKSYLYFLTTVKYRLSTVLFSNLIALFILVFNRFPSNCALSEIFAPANMCFATANMCIATICLQTFHFLPLYLFHFTRKLENYFTKYFALLKYIFM